MLNLQAYTDRMHRSIRQPVMSTLVPTGPFERLDTAMQSARSCLACLPIHCGCMTASWQALSVGGLPCVIVLSFFLPLQSTLALLMSYYAHGSFVQYCIVALPVFKT